VTITNDVTKTQLDISLITAYVPTVLTDIQYVTDIVTATTTSIFTEHSVDVDIRLVTATILDTTTATDFSTVIDTTTITPVDSSCTLTETPEIHIHIGTSDYIVHTDDATITCIGDNGQIEQHGHVSGDYMNTVTLYEGHDHHGHYGYDDYYHHRQHDQESCIESTFIVTSTSTNQEGSTVTYLSTTVSSFTLTGTFDPTVTTSYGVGTSLEVLFVYA
jgi:hypothetical protein